MSAAHQAWTRLPERPGQEAPPALAERRAGIEQARQAGLWRVQPPPTQERLGGVRALRFPSADPSAPLVVHFHGGGFRQGCPEQIAPYAARLAAKGGVEMLCPAYRLAPEHPFPAGLNDAISVIEAVAGRGKRRLILAGDSAGGALATSLALLCVRQGFPLHGLILHSPWLDLTVSDDCYDRHADSDPIFSRTAAEEAAALYLQGQDARNALASPLLCPPDGLPPTFLSIGAGEVVAEDSHRFHAALVSRGIAATLFCVEDMEHVAVVRDAGLVGAAAVFQATVGFIRSLAP